MVIVDFYNLLEIGFLDLVLSRGGLIIYLELSECGLLTGVLCTYVFWVLIKLGRARNSVPSRPAPCPGHGKHTKKCPPQP